MKNHESELQYVTRHVVADMLRWHGAYEDAAPFDEADPDTLDDLRQCIEEAQEGWSEEFKVVALRHQGILWRLFPTLVDGGKDGTLVKISWGWGAEDDESMASVTTCAEDAYDLALEILTLFTDETGQPKRPWRPKHENPLEHSPAVSRVFDDFMRLASAMPLEGGCSLAEVQAWVDSGRPDPVLEHTWQDYPEDHVKICSVCGHYYYTDGRDDYGTRVCWGKPVTREDIQSIHSFDPRRSPDLREAQRLERLVAVMKKCDAKQSELQPLAEKLQVTVFRLSPAEKTRYERERVGLGG